MPANLQNAVKRFFLPGKNGDPLPKYPLLDHIVMVYVGVVLLTYVLFLIAPFVTLIAKTPLYSIQTYLGILGGVLLLADLFTNKTLWRGPYVILLYGICFIALISSVLTISYGISDNLFILCWTVVQFSLFYSFAYRQGGDRIRTFFKGVFYVILFFWVIACCVSIYQYIFQIGYTYVVDPLSDDGSVARQGFLDNRLFGIFNPLNHAAYVSLMLLISLVYVIVTSKKKSEIALLVPGGMVLLLHLMLASSRSAVISMIVSIFVVCVFELRNRICCGDAKKFFRVVLLSLLITACCLGCFEGIKSAVAKVPDFTAAFLEKADNTEEPEEADKNLLARKDIEGNVANNRFQIWEDYLSLYKEIGLFGFSPGNYMTYIRENDPDLYIVSYIEENFPEKADANMIYHVHNGYLMTFVSAGFLGSLLMIVFIFLCLKKIISCLIRQKTLSHEYIFALALILSGAISAVFDKGLFFMNNPATFLFWLAFGFVMMKSCEAIKEETES